MVEESDERLKFIEAFEQLEDEDIMSGNVLKILNRYKRKGLVDAKVIDMCVDKIQRIIDNG